MSNPEQQLVSILGAGAVVLISLYFLLPHITSIGSIAKGPVIPGLRNWANWCFCNSVLQSLSSLPSFGKWLDDSLPLDKKDSSDDFGSVDSASEKESSADADDVVLPLSNTLRNMMRLLNHEGPAKILSSAPLVQAMELVQKTRISRSQQDAQEFLHMLLESVAAEQNDMPVTVSLQQMSSLAAKAGRQYKRLPFEGELKTSSTCTACHHELTTQTSPFLELTLLPPHSSSISLSDCLIKTLESEYIEDYNCVRCQLALLKRQGHDVSAFQNTKDLDELPKHLPRSHITLERRTCLSMLPQVLVLHINRSVFGSYASRNAIDITYGDRLKIQGTQYELRSFVTHKGSHDRGHYISYRRRHGKWFVISDETVRVLDRETVLGMGCATFLMFYEKLDAQSVSEKQKRKKRRKSKSKIKVTQSGDVNAGEMATIDSKI